MTKYPIQVSALRVEQPIGVYYVAVLPAHVLLDVAFSDALSASLRDDNEVYVLDGTQRLLQPKRLQMIADYINREDAAFPNSIILAANYRKEDGLIEDGGDSDLQMGEVEYADDEAPQSSQSSERSTSRRWSVDEAVDDHRCTLHIPSSAKLAAIIDGQHRLFAFAEAIKARRDMHLICSIFLDLPKPYQAQLFATINSTQKPVDKSLTYELFGYNVEAEEDKYWSPDKLAVFLTRRVGKEEKSPLRGRISIAPIMDENLSRLTERSKWRVSTAVVVEGIMRLYTSNPKKDTTNLLADERKQRPAIEQMRKDRSPLRRLYLDSQDAVIYAIVLNYLIACEEVFWSHARNESFITRTVGIQALFDILRKLALDAYNKKDISAEYFSKRLSGAKKIDFASDTFRNASGSGRSIIRRAIEEQIELT